MPDFTVKQTGARFDVFNCELYMHGLKKSLKPGKNSYIPFALLKNIIAELSTIALMRGSVWFCAYRNSLLVIKPFIYFNNQQR